MERRDRRVELSSLTNFKTDPAIKTMMTLQRPLPAKSTVFTNIFLFTCR